MEDRKQTTTRNPAWWNDKHASAWDRVKSAFQRDWEQTKADFSKDSGQKLNQNVGDTVKQSVGSKPIPPLGVKTRPTDPKVAIKEAEKARVNVVKEAAKAAETTIKAQGDIAVEHVKLGEKIEEVRKDHAAHQAKADEKIADAQDKAITNIAKKHGTIAEAGAKRDEAIVKWNEAEEEVRYGYSVRSQYPTNSVWDARIESKLRAEWDALNTGRPWSISSRGIRRGWDYAGTTLGEREAA